MSTRVANQVPASQVERIFRLPFPANRALFGSYRDEDGSIS